MGRELWQGQAGAHRKRLVSLRQSLVLTHSKTEIKIETLAIETLTTGEHSS